MRHPVFSSQTSINTTFRNMHQRRHDNVISTRSEDRGHALHSPTDWRAQAKQWHHAREKRKEELDSARVIISAKDPSRNCSIRLGWKLILPAAVLALSVGGYFYFHAHQSSPTRTRSSSLTSRTRPATRCLTARCGRGSRYKGDQCQSNSKSLVRHDESFLMNGGGQGFRSHF
jgi:hypothetical protein